MNDPKIYRSEIFTETKNDYDLHCQEFAHALINGNLNIDNLDEILSSLNIPELPKLLIMVQLDDCTHYMLHMEIMNFSIHNVKMQVVKELRNVLADKGLDGVVSPLINMNKLLVMPCLNQEKVNMSQFLIDLALDMIEIVNNQVKQNISISFSYLCYDHIRFVDAYHECVAALNINFYKGKNNYSVYDENIHLAPKFINVDLKYYAEEIYTAITNRDKKGYRKVIDDATNLLKENNLHNVSFRVLMCHLLYLLESYYYSEKMWDSQKKNYTLNTIIQIQTLTFFQDIQRVLLEYCNEVYDTVIRSVKSVDDIFRTTVKEILANNYTRNDLNMTKLAALCNYSPAHFSKVFKRVFGDNFNNYLTVYRLEKAKRLLILTPYSVDDISGKVGYSYSSYFCTAFKKYSGMTPAQYRAEGRRLKE